MKINDLTIDGFGVWRGLQLECLSGQLEVFYGPNEAGKTTLMEFVRAVLYGFSPDRRRRYLPPRRGGEAGGTLLLSTRSGDFRITRHDAGADAEGRLQVVDAVGRSLAPASLDELLRHLGEPIFNHVFALGIGELQELGTLSDAEVAARLYQLSTGLRGITLAQVLRELEASRERILAGSEQPGQLAQLLAQREEVRAELQELRKLTGQYAELSLERDGLDHAVAELEVQRDTLAHETRIVEMAIRVRPLWRRRAQLEAVLADRPTYLGVGPDDVRRFDSVRSQLRRRKRQQEELEPEVARLRAALAASQVNDALWRQGPRIETLCDQQDWIAALESQLAVTAGEVTELEAQQVRLSEQLGWRPGEAPAELAAPQLSIAQLRPVARAQQRARQALDAAQQEAGQHRAAAANLNDQIATALIGRPQQDLNAALEQSGQLVNQLRRRLQLDEKIDQLEESRGELEEDNRELYGRQMLSTRTLATLGSVFAAGVAMLLGGLLLPSSVVGGHGLGLAFLGLCSGSGAVVAKMWLERRNEQNLDTCGKQLGMVIQQLEQAIAERQQLDQQLPRGGGPLLARLQVAEKELAALEELLPLEGRRQSSLREAEVTERNAGQAEEDLATARRRWQELLAELHLPSTLRPKQLAEWGEQAEQWSVVVHKLAARRQEVSDRRRALDALVSRLAAVFEETQLLPVSPRIIEQLRQLRLAVAEQATLIDARNAHRKQLRKLRRRAERVGKLIAEFKLRRRTLLMAAGATTEAEFRTRAAEQAETNRLLQELSQVRSELVTALTDQVGEEALRVRLEEPAASQLDAHWEQIATQLHDLETSIRQKFELRGQLNEQLKALAADRRPSEKRLEFDQLNERLAESIHRWQVLAVTHHLLDAIRELYQRERQPITLTEASRYFAAMTSGRYLRVWTPLSDDTLLVDDADGNTLPIDVLSRGTREQLFLSLRLALAADYAARGESFPLVLDDLLVNFDTDRARSTAEVLRDFAAAGHQVLLFTCHEHIKRLFQELGVRVRRLPDNADSPACARYEEFEEPLPAAQIAPAPVRRQVASAAVLPVPSYDVPTVAGEADAFRGWPVEEHNEDDLITIDDQSAFWTLVARTRPWDADGAEEFAGEFAEKVVEEIRIPGTVAPRPRPGRRRRPAGTKGAEARLRHGRATADDDEDSDTEAA